MVGHALTLVDLAVPAKVRDDGEVAPAAINFAGVRFFSSMAIHVCLKRARSSEALIADLALVLLLGTGRYFGIELAHHGLGCRKAWPSNKCRWPR